MPIATLRAVRIARAHPSVRDVRIVALDEAGSMEAELDIVTELPAAWRTNGISPSGVRALETVTVLFPVNFPTVSPRALLRPDFDRSHPHLLPTPADLPPMPCIVQGLPSELIQSRGFEGYVDQLVDWLDKAAVLELNSVEHGWEPVRRNNIDDEMIADGAALRGLACSAGGGFVLRTRFLQLKRPEGAQYVRLAVVAGEQVAVEKAACTKQYVRDDLWQGQGMMLVVAAADVDDAPRVIDQPVPETVSTVADLRDRAELYGCRQELEGKLDHIGLCLAQRTLTPAPLAIVFLVRRPFSVVGVGSDIELCSYVIDLEPNEDLLNGRGRVRLCAIRETISIALLRRASGDKVDFERPDWALLGCGSVGSKIALHAARRGLGPRIVADRSLLSPHNFARHALLPDEVDTGRVLESKAEALAVALGRLTQPATAETEDLISLTETPEGRSRIAGGRLLLNTTASTLLREHLSFLDWEMRPRIAEAHLLGAGVAAYASIEGADGNPNASDLAAEAYRMIAEDAELSGPVFSAKAEAVEIGQGCSSVTFAMPDDRLSTLSAGLGSVVAEWLKTEQEESGQVVVGKLARDGLSQSWRREEIERRMVVDGSCGHQVRISPRVDRLIRAEIASKPGVETGGVIVGRYSQIGNTFQVVDIMPAPPDSVFSAEKFTLGTIGLKASIRKLLKDSGRSLYVLGTWHNHLVESGPSMLDADTAIRLSMRQYFPVLLLIALPEGYTCLTAETFEDRI
ncbi:hypothetical protein HPGCJGGD_0272 [Methylobacterium haplocladii]|nr:hypothetical protein HPGCJGGD_0272 [Methylobacterium haplocladii]